MEGDLLRLDLAILDFHLIPAQDDGDVLANAGEIPMPVGNVLVGDAGGDIEHDDRALALDVVSIAQATKLLLSGGVPHIESYRSAIGMEHQGMDLHAQRGHVLLFEFPGQMTLHKGGFADTAVTHQNEFEFGSVRLFILLLLLCAAPKQCLDVCANARKTDPIGDPAGRDTTKESPNKK